MAINLGAFLSNGTISLSKTSANGSGRERQ